jgi:hypothetical protein
MANAGFWDVIRSIPPVTRFLCGSSLAVTLPIMLQVLSLRRLILVWPLVIQRFEVRLHTLGGYIRSEGAQVMEGLDDFLLWRYLAV